MDSQISETSLARQNSQPPEKLFVRSVPYEWMVDRRSRDSARSYSYFGPSFTQKQCVGGGPNLQKGNKSRLKKRISRDRGISMGGELKGGWLFCRDGRAIERGNCDEVNTPAKRPVIAMLCRGDHAQDFSPRIL